MRLTVSKVVAVSLTAGALVAPATAQANTGARTCEVLVHEAGHLAGLRHTHDGSVMDPSGGSYDACQGRHKDPTWAQSLAIANSAWPTSPSKGLLSIEWVRGLSGVNDAGETTRADGVAEGVSMWNDGHTTWTSCSIELYSQLLNELPTNRHHHWLTARHLRRPAVRALVPAPS